MARSRPDDDDFEDDGPPVRRSKSARRRDDDDEDDEPRPRRKKANRGPLAGIIPYKNGLALLAYYLGFAGLIVILGSLALLKADPVWLNPKLVRALMIGVGGFLAVLAIAGGGVGLYHVSKYPEDRGTAHAVIGLTLGFLELLAVGALLVFPKLFVGN